jgi:outer membrane protein assembly factor BamB
MRRQAVAIGLALVVTGTACGGGPALLAGRAPERGQPRIARTMSATSGVLGGEPGGIAADGAGVIAAVDGLRVVALDARGHRRWSTPVPGAERGWPWMGRGTVVVPTLEAAGPGGCVALDRASGARQWSYQEPGVDGVAVAEHHGVVYCALSDGVVVAIDLHSGVRRWRAVLEPSAPRSLVSVPERTAFAVDEKTRTLALTVWFDRHPYLVLRHLDTGAKRDLVDLVGAGSASSPVSTAPGFLAVGLSEPGKVCIIDLRGMRGHVRVPACAAVHAPTGFDPAAIPVVSGATMVITTKDGWVIAIDTGRMRVLWSVRTPAPILDSHPVVVGGYVLVADWARVPWVFRLRDGSKLGVPRLDGAVIATAAGTEGGFAVAVRGGSGAAIERWALTPG